MKKILVIEDNIEVRENISEILELSDYKVITAENGKKGVELALKEIPDLIVCDIMMPELDGYGVLHLLNKHIETYGIPFIFLTAKSEKTDLRKGMEMGADDYLTKPFDGIELLNAIEIRLKKTDSIKKHAAKNNEDVSAFINEVKQAGSVQLLLIKENCMIIRKSKYYIQKGSAPKLFIILKAGK